MEFLCVFFLLLLWRTTVRVGLVEEDYAREQGLAVLNVAIYFGFGHLPMTVPGLLSRLFILVLRTT